MAIKYLCDRCGADGEMHLDVIISNQSNTAVLDRDTKDLCNVCFDEFSRWWANFKKGKVNGN